MRVPLWRHQGATAGEMLAEGETSLGGEMRGGVVVG